MRVTKIGVIGTPAAAATVLDGYPLTQKGKAKEALSAATLGNIVGGAVLVALGYWFIYAKKSE